MHKHIFFNSHDIIDLFPISNSKLNDKIAINDQHNMINFSRSSISYSYLYDVLAAYGLPGKLFNSTILTQLKKKSSFPYLWEVIISDRYPTTVMLLASKIGMYIPPRFRVGLASYNFYVANVKYYETVIERLSNTDHKFQVPDFNEIYLATDRYAFLLQFRDDEILQAKYRFSRNYTDRGSMIKKFIVDNFVSFGEFTLLTTSRSSYSGRHRNIKYTDKNTVCYFSTADFLRLVDRRCRKVWKDPTHQDWFSTITLVKFKKLVNQYINKWKQQDFTKPIPKDFTTIIHELDSIINYLTK